MTDRAAQDLQREIVAWLKTPAAHDPGVTEVKTIETHGALVFLAGEQAIKIKRAVRFDYMDFSTLDRRERALRHELEINRINAPDIYRDVIAITRETDGRLALGGCGPTVEWALRMRRFPAGALLSEVAAGGPLGADLALAIADAVVLAHDRAEPSRGKDSHADLGAIVASVVRELSGAACVLQPVEITALGARLRARLASSSGVLARRSAEGLVRRVHGDLHLANIVLWQGTPMLFDALEFDDDLATIDLLYDLAFLLMDLDHRGQRAAANTVLSRYLWRTQRRLDLEGLAALPAFMALRAAIRAMVRGARAAQLAPEQRGDVVAEAQAYVARALGYLAVTRPRMIVVGGLSGTGKSTLARRLAPGIEPAPGAVHLRTDLERKALAGVNETDRLPASAYTPEESARVYAHVLDRADAILAAGMSVIVDGVFAHAEERAAIEAVARRRKVDVRCLWLTADPTTLRSRVATRRNDASDATVEVVDLQLGRPVGEIAWPRIDASGTLEATFAAATAELERATARSSG